MFSSFRISSMSVWFSHCCILFIEGRSRSWLYIRTRVWGVSKCFRPSSSVRWSIISTSRCLLTVVAVMSCVVVLLVGLPSISLPMYFMKCWRHFPFSHLFSTSAR